MGIWSSIQVHSGLANWFWDNAMPAWHLLLINKHLCEEGLTMWRYSPE